MHKTAGTQATSHHGPEGLAGTLEKGRLYTHDYRWMRELSSRNQSLRGIRCGEVNIEL